jgi:hypothetical protein
MEQIETSLQNLSKEDWDKFDDLTSALTDPACRIERRAVIAIEIYRLGYKAGIDSTKQIDWTGKFDAITP